MESKTFEQAENFYNKNKNALLKIMHEEFDGTIDHQISENYDQVAVWFGKFAVCYQDSDMNGGSKGEPHFNNDGANDGLDDLKEILKKDERFQPLIAKEEFWKNEFLRQIINDFCRSYAEKHKIADYFKCNN